MAIWLGSGISLFASSGEMESLALADSCSYPGGIVQLRYLRKKAFTRRS
jgi:hypothetical protein